MNVGHRPRRSLVVDRKKGEGSKVTEVRVKAPRKPRAKKEPEPAAVAAGDASDEPTPGDEAAAEE